MSSRRFPKKIWVRDWLISQGRLNASEQPLLERNGGVLRIMALYRIDVQDRHRFEPAVRYITDNHEGGAIANQGYTLKLTYLYRSPKLLIDVNLGFGERKADEINPVYGETWKAKRLGGAVSVVYPVKKYKSSVLALIVIGELFRENSNLNFYDSNLNSVIFGIVWRHRRP